MGNNMVIELTKLRDLKEQELRLLEKQIQEAREVDLENRAKVCIGKYYQTEYLKSQPIYYHVKSFERDYESDYREDIFRCISFYSHTLNGGEQVRYDSDDKVSVTEIIGNPTAKEISREEFLSAFEEIIEKQSMRIKININNG